ncbi:hypothetical protein GFL91_02630 [Rhizobium leguminosarum bv. viciae]|uniref:DUF3618 domain-containing protein n=1 Tax=Rhizobium leguminosarum bv. viciae TaxID=387 RepID=A0A4R0BXC9_RHILV|nr:hypothetical protein [Rhizobium leguminosarum]ASR10681.1 hypothetical protein CHY08_25815 [Rhizobium leguminosarum bv. viciae]MBY5753884.1 hypothetical protein [Rhizobium leguminosarum]MBY5791979.1 hypothetical protein [Rhizobium leguminosarum]MBY5795761.1 hypothetical protein [Rhizobium leguminosarum]MBY5822929.1 hypothetical protein [Rhizobium leguminosarum]
MPRRKSTETTTLDTKGAKIGEPIPKAVIDTNTASVGVPRQSDHDLAEELGALRKQIGTLQQQVLDAARSAKGSAGKAMRQTEAAVKLYPASTLLLIAAVAGALAFAGRRAALPRRRPQPALRELRDLYDTIRERL